MSLMSELDAFYLEHRRCGELESEVIQREILSVVMMCSCGGVLVRQVVPTSDPQSC